MASYYPGLQKLLLGLKGVGSYAKLAQDIGVSERTVIDWCKGKPTRIHDINIEAIEELARKRGIDPALFRPTPILWELTKSYEENVRAEIPEPLAPRAPSEKLATTFLGQPVNSIIAAAPTILTSSAARIEFLASASIDIITYKTVRSGPYRAHQRPNVFAVDRDITLDPDHNETPRVVVTDIADARRMIGMVNRFGVPSLPPEEWQSDFAAARARLRPGQMLILSVMGTAKKDDPETVLISDFVRVVQQALEAGAEAIELNLSCPNCADRDGELYKDLRLSKTICRAVRGAAPHVRLLLKLGYMSPRETHEFVLETAEYVDGYTAINSIAVEPWVDGQSGEVLALAPGMKAGLTGRPIKRHALRMVRQLAELRVRERLDRIWIAGCGGVTEPEDVVQFVQNGADIVEVGTKLLEDPLFGVRARQHLEVNPPLTVRKTADPVDIAHLNWLHAIDSIEGLKHDERGMVEAVHVFFRWRAGHVGTPDRAFRTDFGKSSRGVPTIAEFRRLLLEALPKRVSR